MEEKQRKLSKRKKNKNTVDKQRRKGRFWLLCFEDKMWRGMFQQTQRCWASDFILLIRITVSVVTVSATQVRIEFIKIMFAEIALDRDC
jgi:hypothetical protein